MIKKQVHGAIHTERSNCYLWDAPGTIITQFKPVYTCIGNHRIPVGGDGKEPDMTASPIITLDTADAEKFLAPGAVDALAGDTARIASDLASRRGPGADFLGWMDLPVSMSGASVDAVTEAGAEASGADLLVVIGIGGSYLGSRAVLEALADSVKGPEIRFAGTDLCAVGLARLLRDIEGRDVRLCVISKSGTTLEPAAAYRILRRWLVDRYGPAEAARRTVAVTDSTRGALRRLADEQGSRSFVIPDDVGGRFSVLTPVGLYPLAVAGIDVEALVEGAARMRDICGSGDQRDDPARLYAATRHALYRAGFTTEVLSTFHTDLRYLQEWWKQLYGESEGKGGEGIFPAACGFTTDLHSLGQYLQDGRRDLCETFLHVWKSGADVAVPADPGPDGADRDEDGLGYLVGRSFDDINQKAYEGTRVAHVAGGAPVIALETDRLDASTVGGLIYLFEYAVAISGRLLGVNPFDQPGVDTYKQEMFRLLGRS